MIDVALEHGTRHERALQNFLSPTYRSFSASWTDAHMQSIINSLRLVKKIKNTSALRQFPRLLTYPSSLHPFPRVFLHPVLPHVDYTSTNQTSTPPFFLWSEISNTISDHPIGLRRHRHGIRNTSTTSAPATFPEEGSDRSRFINNNKNIIIIMLTPIHPTDRTIPPVPIIPSTCLINISLSCLQSKFTISAASFGVFVIP